MEENICHFCKKSINPEDLWHVEALYPVRDEMGIITHYTYKIYPKHYSCNLSNRLGTKEAQDK